MKAEIISVGTELLLGNIVNTNAAFMGRKLAELGVDAFYQTVVGDNKERLEETLKRAISRSDIILMTGGLGPTYDDVTKSLVAEHFGRKLIVHESALEKIKQIEKAAPEINPNMLEQMAYIPEGSIPLPNDNGAASGFVITEGEKTVAVMPGPPYECEHMMEKYLMPYLQQLSGKVLVSTFVNLIGISESEVQMMFENQMKHMTNPTIAPYIKPGEVVARITASAETEAEARNLIEPIVHEFKNKCKDHIYGIDMPNIETAAFELLQQKGLTIAIAESCTGGLVSKRLTDIPGASAVYGCGICSYANETKEKMLGVKHETLETYGAVSEQTAIEMANGIRNVSGADIGVSTTGVAGPDGGTKEKPVGLVYVGIATKNGTEAIKLNLRGKRSFIREVAASVAFWNVIKKGKTL